MIPEGRFRERLGGTMRIANVRRNLEEEEEGE